MAISGSFRQQCPSCEANVLIKDGSLIGKKVDCPKCKYRFVVEDPVAKDKKKVAGDTASIKKRETAATAKRKGVVKEEDVPEADLDEPAAAKPRGAGKLVAAKRRRDDEDDDEVDKAAARKTKKKKDSNKNTKLIVGLSLAGVGLVVLAVAALAVTGAFSGGDSKPVVVNPPPKIVVAPPDPEANKQETPKPKEDPVPVQGPPAGPENTNFLPRNSEGVFHLAFKDFLESGIGRAALDPGVLGDAEFQQRLGFSMLPVDDIVTAESYSEHWTFHVLHTTQPIKDMRPLIRAMDLQSYSGNKTKYNCYEVRRNGAWLLALTKLSLFMPSHMLSAQPVVANQQPLLLHMRDAQTIIFAHADPMMQYLKAAGRIDPNPANAGGAQYVTLQPALRERLTRVESKKGPEKVLFSSATSLRAATVRRKNLDDERRPAFQARPIWDVVNILNEKTDRIGYVGTSLLKKDGNKFTFRNSLKCNTEAEANKLKRDLQDRAAPAVVRFFGNVVGQHIDVVDDELTIASVEPPPPVQPGQPEPGVVKPTLPPQKEEPRTSNLTIAVNEMNVDFNLNLILDGAAFASKRAAIKLLAIGLKAEAELASGQDFRFQLGEGGKMLGTKGLSKLRVPPDSFPPGAFPRPASPLWTAREPSQRVSWMAGLLPYLGQETLYSQIHFEQSWRDSDNWLAARTLVPQFLDPSYPITSRYVAYPGLPLECAATHFVGIAGVGMDAADAKAGDAALAGKLGIFGYDRMTPLKDISDKGRGLANTVLLIRVPPNGAPGVTPWMAGGGSTVRTVPEKNSMAPFVSTDTKGESGTLVVMADGSVRFLKAGMSDAAFKAICTVGSPLADAFEDDYPPLKAPAVAELPPLKGEPVGIGAVTGGGQSGTAKPQTEMPTGWKEYSHPPSGFSVNMPAGAAPFSTPVPGGSIDGFKINNEAGKWSYSAHGGKMPPEEANAPPEQLFNAVKKGMTETGQVQITAEKAIKFGNYPVRELTTLTTTPAGQVTGYARIYIVGDYQYLLVTAGANLLPTSPEYRAFFGSFKLTKR